MKSPRTLKRRDLLTTGPSDLVEVALPSLGGLTGVLRAVAAINADDLPLRYVLLRSCAPYMSAAVPVFAGCTPCIGGGGGIGCSALRLRRKRRAP